MKLPGFNIKYKVEAESTTTYTEYARRVLPGKLDFETVTPKKTKVRYSVFLKSTEECVFSCYAESDEEFLKQLKKEFNIDDEI